MGDQDDRSFKLCTKIAKKRENLSLDGDIKSRCRLIGDQDFRLTGKRDSDHHPLPLATRKLVRIIINPRRGIRDPNCLEQVDSARPRGVPVHTTMKLQHLGNLAANREDRIQRRHRFLENHRNLIAANLPHSRLRCGD